jgi:gluconate 2-dehydrogenase subunit 3-like protein
VSPQPLGASQNIDIEEESAVRGPSQDRVSFETATVGLLNAFCDTLLPGGDGFPAPSAIRIVEDFMARYVAPDGQEIIYLPAVTLADVSALADALDEGFVAASPEARAAMVAAFESGDPDRFARLRALVYAGYYSRPEVRSAIANTLDAGRDFRRAPQPYGYEDVMEGWDESLLNHRGRYLATADVRPVDAGKRAALLTSSGDVGSADGGHG